MDICLESAKDTAVKVEHALQSVSCGTGGYAKQSVRSLSGFAEQDPKKDNNIYTIGFNNVFMSLKERYRKSKNVILSVKHCSFDIPNKSIIGLVILLLIVPSSVIRVQHAQGQTKGR